MSASRFMVYQHPVKRSALTQEEKAARLELSRTFDRHTFATKPEAEKYYASLPKDIQDKSYVTEYMYL